MEATQLHDVPAWAGLVVCERVFFLSVERQPVCGTQPMAVGKRDCADCGEVSMAWYA